MTVGDSGSGVRGGGVFFSCEGGISGGVFPFSEMMSFNVDGSYNGALVSGTLNNGVWRGTFNVPAGTPACTMSMTHIEVVDALNHYVRWNGPGCPEEYVSCDEPSVTTIGITPPTITIVNNSTPDEEPPWLSGLSVSTTSVDVTNGAASVVVEMTVGDSGSGVRGGGVFFSCEGGDISNPPFSGMMSFNVDGSYNGALVSGDVYNGVWRGTFNVPAGTPACTMSMTHIEVVDALNNYVRWNGPGCPEEYVSCDEPSVTTIGITPPTIAVVRTD
jgi:hypothetical protein